MPKELAHFKNFAKLRETAVAFNDFTVIAGKPGTGKSYVMKMMYGINISALMTIEKSLEIANEIFSYVDTSSKDLVYKHLDEATKERIEKKLNLLKKENKLVHNLKNVLISIFGNLNQISDNFDLRYNNFKLEYFDEKLKTNEKAELNDDLGEVIFVETPLILEFKKFMKQEKGKTPYHIESLLKILDTDYSFTDEEQDNFIKDFTKKSKEIIRGDIESSGDSFIFNKENDKNYDIVNASSGTKSIGLLQYLVTNKALKKGSVLYWEEPEVHLHPEWQLRMIELFVELMHAGVKIVFSTHSPYMCDYLNAISKKRKFSDRVSFNLFEEKEGVVENHILENQKDWNKIQSELLDPLEEIMWEYV